MTRFDRIYQIFEHLDAIRKLASHLEKDDLHRIKNALQDTILYLDELILQRIENQKPEHHPDRETIEEKQQGTITYRLEKVKCGKPNCKCATGEKHGPYWYAYYSRRGKTVSKYIGKQFKTLD